VIKIDENGNTFTQFFPAPVRHFFFPSSFTGYQHEEALK
jgi:hypothetical protein